jgi:hypothetical protein
MRPIDRVRWGIGLLLLQLGVSTIALARAVVQLWPDRVVAVMEDLALSTSDPRLEFASSHNQ